MWSVNRGFLTGSALALGLCIMQSNAAPNLQGRPEAPLQHNDTTAGDLDALRARTLAAGDSFKIHPGPYGAPRFLSGVLSEAPTPGVTPASHVRRFLSAHSDIFDLDLETLRVTRVMEDLGGGLHIRFEQFYHGVPVHNGRLVAHLDARRVIRGITSSAVSGLSLETLPTLSWDRVARSWASRFGSQVRFVGGSQLTVLPSRAGHRLTYQASALTSAGPRVFWIDAHDGGLVRSENPVREGAHVGTGIDLYGDELEVDMFEGERFPEDVSAVFSIYTTNAEKGNYNLVDFSRPELGKIYTYTANETFLLDVDYVYSQDDSFDSTRNNNHPSGVTAHNYFRDVLEFYEAQWGRRGLDDRGMSVVGVVEVGGFPGFPMECNAGWIGYGFNFMIFGMGGVCYDIDWVPFSASLDVIGHELNHAVDEFTVNLGYNSESGAMNEGLADVFGHLTEAYHLDADWLIGEDLFVDPLYPYDAVRSLKDPTLYWQPAHMEDYFVAPASYDAGGVHYNSGIPNKAFYLMIAGGTFEGVSVPPLDTDEETARWIAADLWWDVMDSERIDATSEFIDLRDALLEAAEQLRPEAIPSVSAAFEAVGVLDDIYPTAEQDLNEPNDYPELAVPIKVGDSVSQLIWARNDADIYVVQLRQNTTCTVTLSDLAFDGQLEVYSDGMFDTLISAGASNNEGLADEVVTFEPRSSGAYYIEVLPSDNDGSRTQPYSLSVQ